MWCRLTSCSLLVVSLVAIGAMTAESSATQSRPATSRIAVGEFVWHDLITAQPERSRRFYGELFGWTFEPGQGVDPGYTIIKHGPEAIAGIVYRQPDEVNVAQWLTYVVVADVDRSTEAFRKAGGRIYREPLSP